MVNGVLRVEDLLVEDEVHTVLSGRDDLGGAVEVEIPSGGAAGCDALLRLFRSVQHPSLPIVLGRVEFEEVGAAVIYASAPSVRGTVLLEGALPSVPAVLRVVERVASVLVAAHAAGVCHRDLQLAQVRIEAGGTVRLDGWTAAASGARRRRITLDSAAYLSPEALQRRDVWAGDVYALGVVLLELLAGQRVTPASVTLARGDDVLPVLRARAPDADQAALDGLVALLRAMLAEDWEARPLAMDVVRRCARLAATFKGTDLVRYAGDLVPAAIERRTPSRGWVGRRLVPRATAASRQLAFGWTLARAG